MTKTISKVGNSQGIIFDAALMDLAQVRGGDQVNITVVPETDAIVLMPLRRSPSGKEVQSIIRKTAKRLSQDLAQVGVKATPNECLHLTIEIVRAIHAEALRQFGRLQGVRDENLLASAVLTPQSTCGGKSP